MLSIQSTASRTWRVETGLRPGRPSGMFSSGKRYESVTTANRSAESFGFYSRSTANNNFEIASSQMPAIDGAFFSVARVRATAHFSLRRFVRACVSAPKFLIPGKQRRFDGDAVRLGASATRGLGVAAGTIQPADRQGGSRPSRGEAGRRSRP